MLLLQRKPKLDPAKPSTRVGHSWSRQNIPRDVSRAASIYLLCSLATVWSG